MWVTIAIIAGILILTTKTLRGERLTRQQIFDTYYQRAVYYGQSHKVAPSMLLSIIEQESSGNASVTGTVGEIGLMQLTQGALTDYNRANGSTLSLFDLFIPELNLKVGSWYFAHVRKSFDNDRDGLRAYNGGVTGARNNPNLSATYADKVLERQTHFKEVISRYA